MRNVQISALSIQTNEYCFRRFYIRSVVPIASVSNMLSTADAFLTVIVLYEFYVFAVDSAKKHVSAFLNKSLIGLK